MAKPAPLNIELDKDLDRRLSEVADAMDQPKAALVEQAVRDFLELRDWQDAAIEEGVTPNELPIPTRD
jgi:predicted transcriptional regulator